MKNVMVLEFCNRVLIITMENPIELTVCFHDQYYTMGPSHKTFLATNRKLHIFQSTFYRLPKTFGVSNTLSGKITFHQAYILTRVTSDTQTLIDHAISNRPDFISENGVIPCGVSDNDVIHIIRTARLPKIKSDPQILNVRNFKRFDKSNFIADLVNRTLDIISQIDEDPNPIWL